MLQNKACIKDQQVKLVNEEFLKAYDTEISPRLFRKFATRSDSGSGTCSRLHVSKGIIDANGGKIIGENNDD